MTEPRHLRLAWGGATDQGRVRAANQDAMFADRGLFVVADGMGGHQGGEVAANLAVRAVAGAEHDSCETLRAAVESANQVVHDTSIARPELHGMGTTLTAIAVVTDERGPHFGLVNVGDSRIYRQRNRVLHQLTYDHSYVAELMRRGDINAEEAANHPYRNMLTRAIGVHAEVEIDEWEVEPEAGDRYLLCSDGLTNEVTDDEINVVLNEHLEVSDAARALVQLANHNGGRDNATVLLVDVKIDEKASPAVAPGTLGDTVEDVTVDGESPEVVEPPPLDEPDETDSADEVELHDETEDAGVEALDDTGAQSDEPADDDAINEAETSEDHVGEDDEHTASLGIIEPPAADTPEDPGPAEDTPQPGAEELFFPDDSSQSKDGAASDKATTEVPSIPLITQPAPIVAPPDIPTSSWLREPVSVTTRGLLIPLISIAVIVAVLGAVGWYARTGYHVGTLGDEIAVFKGRPGGLLWFDPTLEDRPGILLIELSDDDRALVASGHSTESLDGAQAFIDDLATRTTLLETPTTTPPTTGEPEEAES
ncbi:MAG: Stp1/IreP family PP2C-type Ser/Thr phosphatase [Actinomycetota bacterium]|jgi:PPM family protein phosphatase|nr:Stp1/IreP family PP2C-type Ser/Thr phosphatase [Actinomycetota bacterium]